MRVDDPANLWEVVVQISVRWRVRRWVHVAFYDLDTVADRISESGRGYLNEIFRTRETDGAYRDQVYMLVPHTSEGRDCVLSFVRDA